MPMREVRKLCANYVQTMRELVVPVRVNMDTDWHAFVYSSWTMRELVVNNAGASHFVPQNCTTCPDKIVAKSRASVKLALHYI